MLLNLSNHPLVSWSDLQIKTAQQQYGEITDLPFPQVSPDETPEGIQQLAQEYLTRVKTYGTPRQTTVHIMGELNLTLTLVGMLKAEGYTCVASTTKRVVKELANHQKLSEFCFVQFRKY